MPAPVPTSLAAVSQSRRGPAPVATGEFAVVRWTLVGAALVLLLVFLVLPLVVIFWHALAEGFRAYFKEVADPRTWRAIKLTLFTAAIAVPLNTLFGLAAAWLVTKFQFKGKSVLLTLIDLPFSISPVVAGLCLVLLFGAQGYFAEYVNREFTI